MKLTMRLRAFAISNPLNFLKPYKSIEPMAPSMRFSNGVCLAS